MGGDIVYKRRRLTSDKPRVTLNSQSPSQIQEPNSSTNESKVNDQLHINDSGKSEKTRELNEVTSGVPNDASGKRHSLASPDLSAHLGIDLNIPLECGSDFVRKSLKKKSNSEQTEEYNFPGASDSVVKAPAYSSSMGTSSRNACRQVFTDNRREAMPIQANKQQTVANLHSSSPEGVYLHPDQTMNTHATSWSDSELDCLWIGVRRHGYGNWDAILGDPILHSLAWKTPHDLALRWEELRLLHSRTVPQTPLSMMKLPNPNEGSFMWLLRQVEMESAMKAHGIANSPLFTGHANTDSESTISDD